jgi:MFS family permease
LQFWCSPSYRSAHFFTSRRKPPIRFCRFRFSQIAPSPSRRQSASSITLLPVYLQVVKGLDPTSAGLHMTPMMLGVFASSITSGQIISRVGRYKIFPIIGTGLMTIALFLLSRITLETPAPTASVYMLLLGLGLGMVMQVLVMAVQNAVAYEQLGVATSGTTLFRSIGGAVGAALFGGIFNYTLQAKISATLPEAAAKLTDPAAIATLSEPLRSTYLDRSIPCFSRLRCSPLWHSCCHLRSRKYRSGRA